MGKLLLFFRRPIFRNYKFLAAVWLSTALVGGVLKMLRGTHNNYDIFRQVFWHTIDKLPLYAPYPTEYVDVNYYGVFFSLVIAPFALMPVWAGVVLWVVANSALLYWAIRMLPVERWMHAAIVWLCVNELFTAVAMQQFNIAVAAMIILAFVLIEKRRDFWAAFFIMLGTFTKLYGIVGLAFFFFSKNKIKFIGSLLFWAVVMFVVPMLYSSYDYVVSQYADWLAALSGKNDVNMFSSHQNVSLLGMVRKISGNPLYSDLWIIIPGLVLFALPYLRIKQYKNHNFRLMLLSSVLLFVVLFSTGSESSGYITAMLGVAIWFVVTQSKTKGLNICLLVFAFVLTSLSPTDIIPPFIRKTYVLPFALKALPCVLVWLKVCYEMLFLDFSTPNDVVRKREKISCSEIDVVLPCYNPHAKWVEVLIENHRLLHEAFPDKRFRLIVSNDGSKRNFDSSYTDRLMEALPNTLIVGTSENCGKGVAVRNGVEDATAQCVIYTDIDFPYQMSSMCDVISKLEQGGDIVISARNDTYYSELSLYRKVFSLASKTMNRVLLGLDHNDAQGGLKGFNRKGREFLLDTRTERFLFDTEFVYLASRSGDVFIDAVEVNLRSGIVLPNIKRKVIMQEIMNFIRIALR